MKRADAFGLAVYSRRKFVRIDNFYFKDIPNIKITVGNLEKNITFISSYLPSFYPRSDMNSSNHLQQIKNEILSNNTPLIVSGDFNKMYWSADIVEFMELSRLENSRRSSTISNLNPYDHIFFTNDLECIHFEELVDEQQNHIGISGIYQIDKN
jgi:endonuclease/exonuclease/phosphatase (EEP) superfamily protein YafD